MNSMDKLLEIMTTLRDPVKGCPWDREQDFSSIAPYTIEEAYEVADAIDRNDMQSLRGELGDLLFQVVYHAQLAAEKNCFEFNDVVEGINKKLQQRHPHVFGNETVDNAKAQSQAWEQQKLQERRAAAQDAFVSILAGISLNLPALGRAQKIQLRAAHAGFDWNNIRDVMLKIEEEIKELTSELSGLTDPMRLQDELGDLLFSCVNLARHMDIDAESALRAANRKFEQRFRYIEESLHAQHRSLEDASLEEMDRLWEESKSSMSR
jgi:MazG family protein